MPGLSTPKGCPDQVKSDWLVRPPQTAIIGEAPMAWSQNVHVDKNGSKFIHKNKQIPIKTYAMKVTHLTCFAQNINRVY